MSRPRKCKKATCPPAKYEYHCFVSYTTRENEVEPIKRFIDRYLDELRGYGLRAIPVFYDGFYLRDPYYTVGMLHHYLEQAIHSSAFVVSSCAPLSHLGLVRLRVERDDARAPSARRTGPRMVHPLNRVEEGKSLHLQLPIV